MVTFSDIPSDLISWWENIANQAGFRDSLIPAPLPALSLGIAEQSDRHCGSEDSQERDAESGYESSEGRPSESRSLLEHGLWMPGGVALGRTNTRGLDTPREETPQGDREFFKKNLEKSAVVGAVDDASTGSRESAARDQQDSQSRQNLAEWVFTLLKF